MNLGANSTDWKMKVSNSTYWFPVLLSVNLKIYQIKRKFEDLIKPKHSHSDKDDDDKIMATEPSLNVWDTCVLHPCNLTFFI